MLRWPLFTARSAQSLLSPDLDTLPGQVSTDQPRLTSSPGGWPGHRTLATALHCTQGAYVLMFYFGKEANEMKDGELYTCIPLGKCFPKLHIAHYDPILSQES